MADLPAAIAAAREALHEHDAYGMPIDAGTIRDLLDALDAAQGEAVAWQSVRGGRLYLSRHDAVLNGEQMVTPLYLAPQAPPAAVPAGYALVPVEPTEAMLDAGWLAGSVERVWARMLAAARKGAS